MAPFSAYPLLQGLKEKPEALLVQGDRLFVSSGGGNLSIYRIEESGNNEPKSKLTHLETRKLFTKRAVEQLGFIREISSLIVLSESVISLYDPQSLSLLSSLPQTKGTLTFTSCSAIHDISPSPNTPAYPALVTHLLLASRKRLLLFSWIDGESSGPMKEFGGLPHTPRGLAFFGPKGNEIVCGYSEREGAIVSLLVLPSGKTEMKMKIPEVVFPLSLNAAEKNVVGGMVNGLGGYMTLGLGGSTKPKGVNVIRLGEEDGEVFVGGGVNGVGVAIHDDDKIGGEGKEVDWGARNEGVEEIIYSKPFIFTIISPPTVHAVTTVPQPTIQIRSSKTLNLIQTISLPTSIQTPTSLRLITTSQGSKPPLFFSSTTKVDKIDTHDIWISEMEPWEKQVDEFLHSGAYTDGLSLLSTLDPSANPWAPERKVLFERLEAVEMFEEKKYSSAVEKFLEMNINPAMVLSLYPRKVAGGLSEGRRSWRRLFGAPSTTEDERDKASTDDSEDDSKEILESLLLYLTNIRQKVQGYMSHSSASLPAESSLPPYSAVPKSDLLAFPSVPLAQLTPEQILRVGQLVDTALFKSYLIIRPSLVGPLCRLDNFCEVSEVEGILRETKKYYDLIDLYRTRKSHLKAIDLLRDMSKEEEDAEEALEPTIRYLHSLGNQYKQLVFDASRWVFQVSQKEGLKVFTADPDTVEPLPRNEVRLHLETISRSAAISYLEWLIDKLGEDSQDFHSRLAELYLDEVKTSKKKKDTAKREESYNQLLKFLHKSKQYRADQILRGLPDDDLYEARAILLGRLGNHDSALQIYVNRLEDYKKAEDYCAQVYEIQPDPKGVFLTLLRIYLRPKLSTKPLLPPALALIAAHGTRLDPLEVMSLLPPLLTMEEVHSYFLRTLRDSSSQVRDAKVLAGLAKADGEKVERRLMQLQKRRVRITDTRICPQCKKRLGSSAIAIHAPRGEVTHYNCKDSFATALRRSHTKL